LLLNRLNPFAIQTLYWREMAVFWEVQRNVPRPEVLRDPR